MSEREEEEEQEKLFKKARRKVAGDLRGSGEGGLGADEGSYNNARTGIHVGTVGGSSNSIPTHNNQFKTVQTVDTLPDNHWKYSSIYARLGLPLSSTTQQIKKQYRSMALR